MPFSNAQRPELIAHDTVRFDGVTRVEQSPQSCLGEALHLLARTPWAPRLEQKRLTPRQSVGAHSVGWLSRAGDER
jgi:hypothetical protein